MEKLQHLQYHHAVKFTKLLYEKGPEKLAKYLAYSETHMAALERHLTNLMGPAQDQPLALVTGQHDCFCEGCPDRDEEFDVAGSGKHKRCDLTTPEALEHEHRAAKRIRELTGTDHPTIRQIYEASCREWDKALGKSSVT